MQDYSDYKWIKVPKYTMDESKSWEERYKELDAHHIKETSFLINKVRELAQKQNAVIEEIENFDGWKWCECSECKGYALSHAINEDESLKRIVDLLKEKLS